MADLILDLFTVFGPVPPRGADQGTQKLRALMTRHSVAGAVTLSTRGLYHSAHAGNRETQALCAEGGSTLLPAALLDPRLGDPLTNISGARMHCLLPATQGWPVAYAPLADLLRHLTEADAQTPLYFEASRTGDATLFGTLIREAYRTSPIILGGLNTDTLMEAISLARGHSSFYLATSGLRGIGEIQAAVNAVGPERVVFASGAPIRSLGAALALHHHAGLAPDILAQVMGLNAKNLMMPARPAGGNPGGTA